MRILGISGSLRRDSHNTRLLRGVGELLPEGVELEVFASQAYADAGAFPRRRAVPWRRRARTKMGLGHGERCRG